MDVAKRSAILLRTASLSWTFAKRLLGVSVFLALFAAGIVLEGGNPAFWLQLTAGLQVLSVVGGGLWLSHGPRACVLLLASVAGRRVRGCGEAELLVSMSQRGRRLAWTGALLSPLISMIHVLAVLSQPALIAPGVAFSLIGIGYGAILAEVGFGSAERWFQSALARGWQGAPLEQRSKALAGHRRDSSAFPTAVLRRRRAALQL